MADLTSGSRAAVLALILTILVISGSDVSGASTIDNVAVQWSYLFDLLHCRSSGLPIEANVIVVQLHLAQWHALLALKRVTADATTEDLVVAFASHKVLSNYFPYEQVTAIDPLLNSQLSALHAPIAQQTLGKRLGEAVALSVLEKRRPGREFALQALKSALNSEVDDPKPGIFRYINDTPAGRTAATFVYYEDAISRPYVVPDPLRFIKTHLATIKPPIVPSPEWDKAYDSVVIAGRADNPRRTAEMNTTAAIVGCFKVGSTACVTQNQWSAIARATLPPSLSLYDTVVTFAKLAVTMHDAYIVFSTIQYGFWFWRPQTAIRAGDSHHAPVPTWTSWLSTPSHPEYPSGTVTIHSAAAAVMENFFESRKPPASITLAGGGLFAAICPVSGPVPEVHFRSFAEVVAFAQRGRVWAGAHYEKSVVDAVQVGETVAKYVLQYWDETTPSGVLPDAAFLNVVAELPKKQGAWSPIRLEY